MKKVTLSVEHSTPYVEYESPELVMQYRGVNEEFDTLGELSKYLLTSIYEVVMMQGWDSIESFYSSVLGGFLYPKGDECTVWEVSADLEEDCGRITVHLPYFEFV